MKKVIFIVPALWSAASIAFAQEVLADLTQAGARRLSTEEIRALIVGGSSSGPGRNNTFSDITLHPDGKATGYILAGGKNYAIVGGTYRITDDAKACFHYEFNGGISPYDGCVAYYEKDSQYYLAYSDTDPKAPVMKRSFKR